MFTLVRATTPHRCPLYIMTYTTRCRSKGLWFYVFCVSNYVELLPISTFPPSHPGRFYDHISRISAVTTFHEIAMQGRGPGHWQTS